MEQQVPKENLQQLAELRRWIASQPHFPKNIDDKLVIRFLHSNYYNLDKAKSTAELFFHLRTTTPELLTNRDPLNANVQKAMKIVNMTQYPISGKRNLWLWQLNDPGLESYDYLEDGKVFFLSADAWLLSNEELQDEDIVVMDVKDISLKFLTKLNLSIAKKLSRYQEEAMPIRLKEVHIINSPPVIDKLFAVMKPFLKQDMTNMIHFHTPKSSTFQNKFGLEELPSDFGGTRGSMDQHMQNTVKLIMDNRDFFLDDRQWKSTKQDKKSSKAESIETGSFRTLAID